MERNQATRSNLAWLWMEHFGMQQSLFSLVTLDLPFKTYKCTKSIAPNIWYLYSKCMWYLPIPSVELACSPMPNLPYPPVQLKQPASHPIPNAFFPKAQNVERLQMHANSSPLSVQHIYLLSGQSSLATSCTNLSLANILSSVMPCPPIPVEAKPH